jgi:hypothetical protein
MSSIQYKITMKNYKQWLVGVLCALALVTSTFAADTVPVSDPVQTEQISGYTLSLGGAGVTTTGDDTTTAFGLNVGLGLKAKVVVPVEVGVRQGVAYAYDDGNSVIFDTSLFADATLVSFKGFDVFAGVFAGPTYGNTTLKWNGGPEVGVRYWLKKDVAIVGRVDYGFDLVNWKSHDALRYFLGFRVDL